MNAKAKGTRNEHRSMQLLEAGGYRCTRAAASLGAWDVIGVSATDMVLVQVKSSPLARFGRDGRPRGLQGTTERPEIDSSVASQTAGPGRSGSVRNSMTSTTEKQRRNTENLRPWKPGESGNPKGRPPKSESLTSLLRAELEKVNPDDAEGRTWRELLILATVRLAVQGNKTALTEVWNRSDGKVAKEVALTDNRAEPYIAQVVLVEAKHEDAETADTSAVENIRR